MIFHFQIKNTWAVLIFVRGAQKILISLFLNFSEKSEIKFDNMSEQLTLEILKKTLDEQFSKLATKDEISKLVTKDEISKLATKDDLTREIDGLAQMIQGSFDEVDEKFAGIGNRLGHIEARWDMIESDLAEIRKKLDFLEQKTQQDDNAFVGEVFELKKRVEKLEGQLRMLQASHGH